MEKALWTVYEALSKDFYECATKECDKINILYTPKENVEENKALLDSRFCRAIEIPGIRSYHFFQRADETHVYAQRTSVSKKIKIRVLEAKAKHRLRYTDVYTSSEDEAWPSLLEDIDETTLQQYEVLASDTPVCGNSDNVEEGTWVVVIYDGWYPDRL
ncbi:hypothetical protein J6590_066860 [Homalodisca vitripennis]|nr:hypothetical protein J6590_066860 [Homalodisca vitripennis]